MMRLQSAILLLWWYTADSSLKYTFPPVQSTTLQILRDKSKIKYLDSTNSTFTDYSTQEELANILKSSKTLFPNKNNRVLNVLKDNSARIPSEAEKALMDAANNLYMEILYDKIYDYFPSINLSPGLLPYAKDSWFSFDWLLSANISNIPLDFLSYLPSSLFPFNEKHSSNDRTYKFRNYESRNALLKLMTESCNYIKTEIFSPDWHLTEDFEKFRDETLAIAEKDSKTRKSVEDLKEAATAASDSVIKFLIQNRVNINLKTFLLFGKNALIFAAENGLTELVEVLLNNKANPNIKTWWLGKTPLMLAAEKNKTDAAQVLIKKGAKLNQKKYILLGQDALMAAAKKGNAETAKLLLDSGANPNAKTWLLGKDASWFAKKNGYMEIAEMISKHIGDKSNAEKEIDQEPEVSSAGDNPPLQSDDLQ
jgi:thermostable 8-oxoguanine DNA glycosylase